MVEFWECPSKLAWLPHVKVDKETRQYLFIPQFLYKNIHGTIARKKSVMA